MDNINTDLSDFEFIEHDGGLEAQTPGADSKPSDVDTPGGGADGDESDKKGEEGEADGYGYGDHDEEELVAIFDHKT